MRKSTVEFEVLLFGFGSVVGEETLERLITICAMVFDIDTVNVNVELPPGSSEADRVHVTTRPTAEHAQPSPTPDTKAMPRGNLSVTVGVTAADGPRVRT